MSLSEWGFGDFAQTLRELGFSRPPASDIMPGAVHGNGSYVTNFAPVNFLNLQRRADVMERMVAATQQYGLASGGSRTLQGVSLHHLAMEETISRYLGKEASISFGTGVLANIGFIHAMSGRQVFSRGLVLDNSDTVFVFDRDAHWSLWKAAEGLKYGERLFSFKHNRVDELEKVLQGLQGKRVVVVFESVYSIDGTVAPMHEIVDVCEKYGALSFCDDANGFLVYGPSHRRFYDEYQGLLRSTFIMVSMKKAVGVEGGLIAGPRDAIEGFEVLTGTATFTAGMSAPAAAATDYITQLLAYNEPGIVDNYLAKVEDFRRRLFAAELPVTETETCFTSIQVGDEHKAFAVHHDFLERGFRVPVYCYPATKRNEAVLRIILNDAHTDEQTTEFIKVASELRDKYGFDGPKKRPNRNASPLQKTVTHVLNEPSQVEVRPRYEGNNINTWIGFKHVNYMVEEAVLGHFRAAGLSSRTLFEEYGLGLDIARLDTRILNAFHLDESAVATVTPVGKGQELTFRVTLSKSTTSAEGTEAADGADGAEAGGKGTKDVTAQVKVVLRREKYVDATNAVPRELSRFAVNKIAHAQPERDAEVTPSQDWGITATHRTDPLLKELTEGRNAIGWRWRIPYPYCHNNERLQMSGYLRLMEEAKDRFVADRGISIKTLLDERKWIPVVPRSRIEFLDEALMEEELYIVYSVEDVFKDFTYTSRMDCYVVRDGKLVPTATGTIVHGYAEIADRKNWSLVSFDDRVLAALNGTVAEEGTAAEEEPAAAEAESDPGVTMHLSLRGA
ncbi:aminotransferase class I/II-fold pyridoxal phosphate-dependent enzyme [Streptomyces sp. LX-29]|uniref:aminotransferase class I/II-fold pyridoxal phosphate-dependent enzyme n=1 Tax=Streptomyces sp. LX-29 TaxID=2900152 RepID=UPI00321951D6